jgi:hypothetical protein
MKEMSVTQKQQQQEKEEKDNVPIIGFLDTLAAVASIQERADTLVRLDYVDD